MIEQIPDLEWFPPGCARCSRTVEPLPSSDGWRCDHCRLMWDLAGRHGQPDERSPLDRLRQAYEAHGRMDISTAEFSDRVWECLEDIEKKTKTIQCPWCRGTGLAGGSAQDCGICDEKGDAHLLVVRRNGGER